MLMMRCHSCPRALPGWRRGISADQLRARFIQACPTTTDDRTNRSPPRRGRRHEEFPTITEISAARPSERTQEQRGRTIRGLAGIPLRADETPRTKPVRDPGPAIDPAGISVASPIWQTGTTALSRGVSQSYSGVDSYENFVHASRAPARGVDLGGGFPCRRCPRPDCASRCEGRRARSHARCGTQLANHLNLKYEDSSLGRGAGRYGPSPTETGPAVRRSPSSPTPRSTVLTGADLYRLNCQACHRAEGTGAPSEIKSVLSLVQGSSFQWLRQQMKHEGKAENIPALQAQATKARAELYRRIREGGQRIRRSSTSTRRTSRRSIRTWESSPARRRHSPHRPVTSPGRGWVNTSSKARATSAMTRMTPGRAAKRCTRVRFLL